MRKFYIAAGLVIAGLIILMNFVFFTVDQTEQALVVQLGQPQRVVTEPGLNVLIPFVQTVYYFEKRVLDLDAPTEEVTSSDQKRLLVDAFARYRIVDALKFYQTVNNQTQAEQRLSAILNSNIRVTIAQQTFMDVLATHRSDMMVAIRDSTNKEAESLGIQIVDVRIRRADLPEANSDAIYERMKSDRVREATDIRAKGNQAKQEIEADADKQATIIIAEATKQSDILRGEGEAERNKIYADAYSKDPAFFEFYRSMQAYTTSFGDTNTSMVLSPDSTFFRYFKGVAVKPAPSPPPAAAAQQP